MTKKPTEYIKTEHNPNKWTQEMEDDIFLWKFEKHMTAAQVSDQLAKKYGVRFSRSAVLGKIHRVINGGKK